MNFYLFTCVYLNIYAKFTDICIECVVARVRALEKKVELNIEKRGMVELVFVLGAMETCFVLF